MRKLSSLEPQTPDYSVVFGRAGRDAPVKGGTRGLEYLIRHVIAERQKLIESGYRHVHRSLWVPGDIVSVLVDGDLYRIPPKPKGCEFWFRRLDNNGRSFEQNYDLQQICLKEVVDMYGHYHQIHLRLDDVSLTATVVKST